MNFSALHEHLDGGLRPNTIIEIATSKNISVPSRNEESLRKWFFENISSEKKQLFKMQKYNPVSQMLKLNPN